MSRALLDAAFAAKKHHLSPFLVLGDPTPEVSFELAKKAVELGATMLEVGIARRIEHAQDERTAVVGPGYLGLRDAGGDRKPTDQVSQRIDQ